MKELARHIMVDFLPMKTFAEDPLILTEGRGIYVTDVDGKRYIDGLSGTFCMNLGHGNRAVIDAATRQMERLALACPTLGTSDRALELTANLHEITPPPYTTVKLLSGGSEATESALKMARQYHKQTGAATKYKVLSHYRGYHGATGHGKDRRPAAGRARRRGVRAARGRVHPPAHAGSLQSPRPRNPRDAGSDVRGARGRSDPARGAGDDRGIHHRADHDLRRRRRAAARLPAADPRAVRPVQHRAHLRRDHHGRRTHGAALRRGTLGRVARHPLSREGDERRLRASVRHRADGPDCPRVLGGRGRRGTVSRRPHVRRQPRGVRRRAGRPSRS